MSDRSIKSIGAKPSEAFNLDRLQTPIGTALLVTDADGILRALDWEDYETRMKELLRLHYGAVELKQARAPRDVRIALPGYFKGDLDRLAAIEWRVAGTAVPAERLARAAENSGRDHAELRRAGGEDSTCPAPFAPSVTPMARTRSAWSLPCHRLIGANGSLVKYGGGTRAEALAAAARGRESPGAGR